MRVKRTVHDDDRRLAGRGRLLTQWKRLRVVTEINRADFFTRIAAGRKPFGKFVGDGAHAIHAVAHGQRNFVAHERADERFGRDIAGPRFHEAGEQVGEIHHHRHAKLALQFSGGNGGNGVLRKQQVKFCFPRGGGDHAFEKKRIRKVFEIAKLRVTAHLPSGEWMQPQRRIFFAHFPRRESAGRRRGLRGRAGSFPGQYKRPPPNRRRRADKTVRESETQYGAEMEVRARDDAMKF